MGIDRASEALRLGIRFGIIASPSKGWYQLPDREVRTNGEAKVLGALRESPELVEQVRAEILSRSAEEVGRCSPTSRRPRGPKSRLRLLRPHRTP